MRNLGAKVVSRSVTARCPHAVKIMGLFTVHLFFYVLHLPDLNRFGIIIMINPVTNFTIL
jgi:glucose-6-phosphate-specific signal transduction histidine kinase